MLAVDWGDVAGWSGVVLAFLGGAIAALQRGRDDAAKVVAWQDPERPENAWVETAGATVRDVVVTVVGGDRADRHRFERLLPGHRLQVPLAFSQRRPALDFVVEFTDGSGRRWRRSRRGHVLRVRRVVTGVRDHLRLSPQDRAERAMTDHSDLVRSVLLRAEVLRLRDREEVPITVAGHNPAVVTLHPSGRRFAYYSDVERYRSAAQRGEVNPVNAKCGRPPLPLSRWSDDRLRLWLRDYVDRLPPQQ